MLLTEEEANNRLNSPNNLANRFSKRKEVIHSSVIVDDRNVEVFHKTDLRKGERGAEIPLVIKDTVGILARLGESPKSIEETFEITPSAISQIKNGRNKKHNQERIEEVCSELSDIAISKFLQMADSLDADKIANAKFSDLSKGMANMTTITKNLNPKILNDGSKFEVHIHAPNTRDEKTYEVING